VCCIRTHPNARSANGRATRTKALTTLRCSAMLSDQRCDRLSRRVPPADAERMSSRVGIHLVAFVGIKVNSRLEQSGSERQGLLVRGPEIVDVEVEVDLWLRGTVGPHGRNMLRCELHPDPPLAFGVNNTVPAVVLEYSPAKDPGPERALSMAHRRVKHHDLTDHPHREDRTGGSGGLRHRLERSRSHLEPTT
jgi:hypothetical protein